MIIMDNSRFDINQFYYYNGSGNKFLDRLKFQYGIILCGKHVRTNSTEDTFMYYDPIKRKDVYKPNQNRKSINLSYYYYDFSTKNIHAVDIIDRSTKNYSETFFKLNFIRASTISKNIDDMARILKLKKLMKRKNG